MSEKDFDKGYKSGFQFGKEVANEEWMNRIKQARAEIQDNYEGGSHADDFADGYDDNAINDCVEILDKLITESEGE